ncbi:MAG: hypothetical protein ABSD49_15420 [Candidatus Bathyarchaeia archaeon]|jgi:hypothetical protein
MKIARELSLVERNFTHALYVDPLFLRPIMTSKVKLRGILWLFYGKATVSKENLQFDAATRDAR